MINYVAVCLSTVDRRSRERFLESNQQISVLVDKFKAEGGVYLKDVPQGAANHKDLPGPLLFTKLGRGIKPGCFSTLLALYWYFFFFTTNSKV